MNRVLTSWGGIACLGLLFAAGCSSSPGSSSGTGGSSATGGSTGTGGSATGGSSATGGTVGTGGSGTGGGSGGIVGTGGHTGGNGGSATGGAGGGSPGTGGSATGGAGGSSTGGGGSGQVACPTAPPAPTGSSDAVAGTLIQFNDNGGWCWYQDERAVVDTKANKLVIATTASGGNRNGQNEAVIYDIASGTPTRYTLPSSLAASNVDDHNSPALLIRPDGKYMAQWSGHRVDCLSRFSIFDPSTSKWGSEYKVDWTNLGCPWAGASTNMITYSNPWYMGSSVYTMVRSVGTDPGVLSSSDDGSTFSYYGRLMDTVQTGYVAGYFKYWGNNTDRVDFVGTEAHPRDDDTSLYHGYITGGKVYNSMGTVMDSSLKDTNSTTTNSVNINTYTPVFKTGSMAGSVKLCRMWNYDIARYADGSIAVLGQGRANSCTSTPSGSDPDKRAIYSRWDGSKWTTTYLVKMGSHLYSDEEDYTGLAALDPDNPNIIYISTTYDPRNDTTMTPKHEIYEGITCDQGKTFTWSNITKNSTADNLRPIVPKWDANHTALIWLKGSYTSAQNYALKVVGTITSN